MVNIPLFIGFHTSQVVGLGISAINSSFRMELEPSNHQVKETRPGFLDGEIDFSLQGRQVDRLQINGFILFNVVVFLSLVKG